MKKLLVLVVVLSMATVACQAFKDSYDQQPAIDAGTENPPSGDENVVVCTAIEGIKVTLNEKSGVVTETVVSTLTDAVLTTTSQKLADDIVKVTVMNADKEEIVIALKKVSDTEFSACSAAFEGTAIVTGEIAIDSFDLGEKLVNAGTFKLDLVTGAVNIMKAAVGAEAATSVEGSYYTEGYQK